MDEAREDASADLTYGATAPPSPPDTPAKAEKIAARLFVNAITKGVKIENPEQARAITNLIREMNK